MVIKNSLAPAILLNEFPGSAIEVYVSIIQADAGTRCACISAASLALADAGIPMKDLVCSVACGGVNGMAVVDLDKAEEDIEGVTDIPIAYLPRSKKLTLLQADGKIEPKLFKEALKVGIKGCEEIYELQKKVLKEKYTLNGEVSESKD